MYRFTSRLSQSHLVLVRKKLSDGSCAALVVMRAPVRRYAKEFYSEKCPDPPKVHKSKKLLFGVIGATLMTGAAVVYAKNSKEARTFLEANLPWANDFVALVYQENTTYLDWSLKQAERVKNFIMDFVFGKEGISPMDFKQRSEQDLEKDAEIAFAPKIYPLPPPALEPLYVEPIIDEKAEVELHATLVQTEKCEPMEPFKVDVSREAKDLELDLQRRIRLAIDNLKLGGKLSTDYSKALQKVIEQPPGSASYYSSLKGIRIERDKVVSAAKESASVAVEHLDTLEKMLENKEIAAPPENLTRLKRFIDTFRMDLEQAQAEFIQELNKFDMYTQYWDKIQEARNLFKEELRILFPGVDLCAKKLDLKGDIDIFILFCLTKIQFLENTIAELQTKFEQKVAKAIECNDEKAIIEAKAEQVILKERLVMEADFQKKLLKVTAEAHKKQKQELLKQFEAQERVNAAKILRMEAEIMAQANRLASEEIQKERVKFKKELAVIAGKLKAIEQTLKQRSQAEADTRRSQSIWAAAEALLQATRRPACSTKVDGEIKALAKAGEKDKLVQTVLKGISEHAVKHGIATEKALKEKFDTLEQTASKVALVGRTGGALPVYFMSWVQSKLLFYQLSPIPQSELDNLPTDFTKLDTFEIMQRARYHMDNGDLATTLRYVNLLQGAPRAAATCWAQAARDHLEVKQAAQTVMAHASLSGMLYS